MAVLLNKKNNYYYVDTKIKRKDGTYYHFKYQDNKNPNFKVLDYVRCIEKELISNKKRELNNELFEIKRLVDSYFEYIKVDIRISTLRTYESKTKNYILNYFINIRKLRYVNEILNSNEMIEFRNYIGSLELINISKNKIIHVMKELIKYSKYLRLINSDTKDDLLFILKGFKEEGILKESRNTYTSIEELNIMLSNCNDFNHKVLLLSLYFSCSRIGEFLGIKVKDIEIFENHLEISLKRQKGEDDKTLLDTLKTKASYKKIYYYNPIKDMLLKYIKDNNLKSEDLLFDFTRNTVRRILDKYLSISHIKHNTLHGFMRKSINTEMYMKTKDVKLCMSLLGQVSENVNLIHYVDSMEYENEIKDNLTSIYEALNV